jgi:3-dehydroquinate synthase
VVTIRVPLVERRDASYDIRIGRGLLGELPALLAAQPAARCAVISDSHVGKLYGERVVAELQGADVRAELITFPAGEWNKTRETWSALSDRLLAARFGRDGVVLALGGGVVGDVAGFVAATYLRGVPWVQVPTTLLAMIDSSIGGKTGVDVVQGKNLLGAFHQPRLVVADLDVLATLPGPQLVAGMAEAIKHGVIADADYCDLLAREQPAIVARDLAALERVVVRSVEVKAEVVSADERETGRRAVLNFGHTVGHAVEATSGYALLHGEAVASGVRARRRAAAPPRRARRRGSPPCSTGLGCHSKRRKEPVWTTCWRRWGTIRKRAPGRFVSRCRDASARCTATRKPAGRWRFPRSWFGRY